MKAILGTKNEMTQFYTDDGIVVPVTIVEIPKNTIITKKTIEKDGYEATQIGAGEKREKLISKPQKGQFADLGNFRYVREFDGIEGEIGSEIKADQFTPGEAINVVGISKGKGFQGVVKRHGFAGGPKTHGHRHFQRKPGSIGATGLNRVIKGMRMAGRMGADRVTVKNLEVVHVDTENRQILIKGAVPGRRGTLLEIYGQ